MMQGREGKIASASFQSMREMDAVMSHWNVVLEGCRYQEQQTETCIVHLWEEV